MKSALPCGRLPSNVMTWCTDDLCTVKQILQGFGVFVFHFQLNNTQGAVTLTRFIMIDFVQLYRDLYFNRAEAPINRKFIFEQMSV